MDISKISSVGSPKSKMIYHENTEALHIGTLDKHCYFIPFSKGQDPFESRENSARFELLNGDWNFKFYGSIIDIEDDFISSGFDKKYPCPQTGSFTAMTSPNTQTSATLSPMTRRMCPMISPWASIRGAITILPTETTGYLFSRA